MNGKRVHLYDEYGRNPDNPLVLSESRLVCKDRDHRNNLVCHCFFDRTVKALYPYQALQLGGDDDQHGGCRCRLFDRFCYYPDC